MNEEGGEPVDIKGEVVPNLNLYNKNEKQIINDDILISLNHALDLKSLLTVFLSIFTFFTSFSASCSKSLTGIFFSTIS